jgi:hypothetical protein
MIGSNEKEWTESQIAKQSLKHKARRVHSGIDPEESFNTFRGGLLTAAVMLVIIGVICGLFLL